ncbi:hypothetical protein P154DRAFT_582090 [Amniculicola lignicola CBS 123094]|uniref:Uncharacterized protein n=1 Tax=Amniculicola lignicola CBS 123094 TaxID=1392246 RepID=A0A6A5W204_9PLEO|nr:hypothetical protein P154DRAFT_582090 [Amniculicola lignicola CBS 123094]
MRLETFSIITWLASSVLGIGCYRKGIKFFDLRPGTSHDAIIAELNDICHVGREEKKTCRSFGNNSIVMSAKNIKDPKKEIEYLTPDGCYWVAWFNLKRCPRGGEWRQDVWSEIVVRMDPQEERCVKEGPEWVAEEG